MAGHRSSLAAAGRSRSNASQSIKMVAPVSTSFCLLDEAEILIQRLKPSGERMYAVHDARGNLAFDVTRGSDPSTSSAVLRDEFGENVLNLRKERSDVGSTVWAAYRSESDDTDENLLFTIRKVKKLGPSFEIVLPSDTNEHESKGPNYTGRTRRLFQADLSVLRDRHQTPIARVNKNFHRTEYHSVHREKSQYGVTIHPGIDRAFIASICIVLDLVHHNWSKNSKSPRVHPSRMLRASSEDANGWSSHQAERYREEHEHASHSEYSLDAYAANEVLEIHSSPVAVSLSCTLCLGSYLKSSMTLAGVLVSFYLAIF